ncbi:MAG: AsmA-like C-terminal region-containing protein [Methylacidiphilales bacterium]|nr:AsmA-like C-terminal region-containing protein [Candidatus Methylacidiphilales bacterium]
MKKVLSILLAGLLLFGCFAYWWVQSYIGSPEIIENIRILISRRVGGELNFEKPEINLLSGMKLQNLKLSTSLKDASPFLALKSATLKYAPLSLLRHRIELTIIRLQDPRLLFIQQNDGTWNIPHPSPDAAKETLTFETGFLKFEVLLRDFDLRHGGVEVRTASNEILLHADDVSVKGGLHLVDQNASADGAIRVQAIRFGPHLCLRNIRSQIEFRDNVLTLRDLTGDAYGGKSEGAIVINTGNGTTDPTYNISLKLTDLDLRSLMKDFEANPEFIQGKINLSCEMEGNLKQPRVMSGKGSLESQGTQLTGLKALDALGTMLKLPELRYTKFDSIKGTYKLSDEQLTFYSLEAISPNLKMTGTGSIKFDRNLDFDILLILSPELAKQIPAEAEQHFSKLDDGSRTITFKLNGSLDQPVTNLAEKLNGQDATNL